MTTDGGQHQPWDRLPRESSQAFAGFRAYLDGGPDRSIEAAAEAVGRSPQLLYRWSSQHRWVDRARAWDSELARQRDEALVGDRKELLQRRLRRAKEADAVGRALTHMGLRPGEYAGASQLDPAECLRYGEKYSRFATELEDRVLAGDSLGSSSEDTIHELFGLDDPALRRVIEEAKRAEQDQEEVKEDD